MSKKLVKAEIIAERFDISKQAVWRLSREGKIPNVRVGDRQYRYDEDAISVWISHGGNNNLSTNNEEQK